MNYRLEVFPNSCTICLPLLMMRVSRTNDIGLESREHERHLPPLDADNLALYQTLKNIFEQPEAPETLALHDLVMERREEAAMLFGQIVGKCPATIYALKLQSAVPLHHTNDEIHHLSLIHI